MLVAPGCGDDDAGGDGVVSTADAGSGEADVATTVDGASEDVALPEPDVAAPQDAGAVADDTAAGIDTGAPECPGQPGCVCSGNSDCDTGICVPHADHKACAQKCVDSCPSGYRCAAVSTGGADTVQVCVPTQEWLCDPCSASKDCGGIGLDDAACVRYGVAGAFCGTACSSDGDCPGDYRCKAATSVEGKPVKQCVAKSETAEQAFGECKCSDAAIAKELQTQCFIEHLNKGGELVGKCAGDRVCKASGLSACQAPSLEVETCNGLDDDCDGKTDEGTCDDSNSCTLDACDKGAAGKTACVNKKLDALPCDADGSACTEKDACQQGLCVPGKPIACDDGNGCTTDACDPAAGCTQTNDDGKACEADGNPCTAGDSCEQGKCKAGLVKACSSGDLCVLGKCDPSSGKCAFKKIDAPCDDGNACTDKDACDDGFCTGSPTTCNDNNPCTADTCDKTKGCAHKSTAAACDDGSACTWSDACADGTCTGLPISATDCDDANPCTLETCNPTAKGKGKLAGCVHSPAVNQGCDDGDPCTAKDTCVGGKCTAGVPAGCQCQSGADCVKLEDGNGCNGTLYCDKTAAPFTCKLDLKSVVTCQDDGNVCTVVSCDPKKSKCATKNVADGKLCDADGSVCSQKDACASGKCTAGPTLPCDDNNACTADSCDPKQGCAHSKKAGTCEDGDACTSGDQCGQDKQAKWRCLPGKAVNCDDANLCTVDSCDAAKGCVKVVDTTKTKPCYSGPKGTSGVGTCKGGAQRCQSDGSLGPCNGEVTPATSELCDGKDDDCDGKTDIGCAAAGFAFKVVAVAVDGPGARLRQVAVAGGSSGQKTDARLGWLAWLQRWIK